MLLIWLVLSFATYRVTRFFLDDSLIDNQRVWFHKKVLKYWAVDFDGSVVPDPQAQIEGHPVSTWRMKIWELTTCPYCFSVWVAFGAVVLASLTWSAPQPFWLWLATAALSVALYRKIEE